MRRFCRRFWPLVSLMLWQAVVATLAAPQLGLWRAEAVAIGLGLAAISQMLMEEAKRDG